LICSRLLVVPSVELRDEVPMKIEESYPLPCLRLVHVGHMPLPVFGQKGLREIRNQAHFYLLSRVVLEAG
jgi:hypothetical protein